MNNTELLSRAVFASLQAGKKILEIYETDFSVEHKADDSPLTLADKESHECILMLLKPFGIPILSEEGRKMEFVERSDWNPLWVVDPLDGTKEFINRNGEFTVNIALVRNHRPVMGVIYVPVKQVLYFAAREMGAYRLTDTQLMAQLQQTAPDAQPSMDLEKVIAGSRRIPLSDKTADAYRIVGSRSHGTPELEAFVKEKERTHSRVNFLSAGSSLKFCLVAEGSADIYPRLGPTMEWDTAAGQVIAECAGAHVLDWQTRTPLTYNKADLLNPYFVVTRETGRVTTGEAK